ncbi:extracellular solute-binding protein [uncultured Clostridium sp.]|uniref:extracellular solute-binding protein n=1 Tax=uncultured Clostridium sp. TaxID=59620 RepID=UPI0025CC1892|nr:extracellular solute-binding protein [uncultured Clostridium sp.]
MKVKKMLSILLSASIAATCMLGCGASSQQADSKAAAGGSDGGKITLKVWAPQEDQKPSDKYPNGIVPYLCDKFKEAHPEWDITFDYGVMSEGDVAKEALKDLDQTADVYMFANDQIPTLVEAGAIAKLGGKAVEDMKANNSESMVGTVTYNDGVYGIPYTPNTYFLYYDKSKYNEEEVKSLDTMMGKDLGDGVVNFSCTINNSWYTPAFFYAAGGQLFGPDGTDNEGGTTFGDHPEVTEYLVNLKNNPKFFCEAANADGASLSKFKDGKLGAYVSGSWDAAAIKEYLGDNFGVTKLPTITLNGEQKQLKSFAGSKVVGVNPTCKNMEQAVALAAYLGGEESQKLHFTVRGYTPTWKSVTEMPEVKADPVAAAQTLEINEASVTQPLVKNMNNFWTPMEALGKSIVQGDVTLESAADATKQMGESINK